MATKPLNWALETTFLLGDSDDRSSSQRWDGLEGGREVKGRAWVYPQSNNCTFWLPLKTPSFQFLTHPIVLPAAALTTPSSVSSPPCVACLHLMPCRSRRTSRERWPSGWPTPQNCSTSSSRTETWTASRSTPRTSSPTWFRWPSSESAHGGCFPLFFLMRLNNEQRLL